MTRPAPHTTAPAESNPQPMGLQDLMDVISDSGSGAQVSVNDILERIGTRSFGALLLAPSLLVVTPISGIPGVPTTAAIIIILICLQYLSGRRTIWLPRWILRARIGRARLDRAMETVRPVVRNIDKVVRPRFGFVINRVTFALVALVCAVLAATMPPLEFLPFTATTTALIITLFALSLLARDGLLALIALAATTVAAVAFVVWVVPALAGVF
ncbi:exopolysaccharide biosynthesis protein [Acuticoccus sp. MNP-M23]|uniref:exopolysaccharide biosynthesis protein n=1 Tax=Acuticoccus sp. MNP-M23 TaxID=3072793 RepID=UPI0028161F92|nr:exopolysaccharide biosynthesis protein [Acuticoccus sp. MNP-M23]WMS41091.1 exopolysaccharide biosynthesis protein [Acuticoccus sp. MNP-M23]